VTRDALTLGGAALVVALVAGGCGKSSSHDQRAQGSSAAPPTGSAGSAGSAAAGPSSAGDKLAIMAGAVQLPGTLWFVGNGSLARLANLTLATTFDEVGAAVYPSPFALPDRRLVGIASRGDGSAGSEQLVLIGPDKTIERIGEPATAVRDPAVDPAGAWIIYEAKTESASELWRLDLQASKATKIIATPQGDFRPAVLANDTIVFVSSRDGDSEIYRARIDGTQLKRLTAFHRDDWEPTPSPDRKTIAFTSDREGRPRVFLMDPDGTHQRRLTGRTEADVDERVPVWSPDGGQLAYLLEAPGRSQLWLRDVASGTERVLTPDGARDEDAAFSPDGAWIAVTRTPTRDARHTELWAIPTAGGAAVRITKGGDARLPRWR